MRGEVSIDYAQRTGAVSRSLAPLTPTELNLLAELATDAGRVGLHERLLSRCGAREDRETCGCCAPT